MEGLADRSLRIHYLCDGKMEGCAKRICYRNRGNPETACRHTQDIRYAKNFHRPYPQAGFWEQEALQGDRKRLWMLISRFLPLASTIVALISISVLYTRHSIQSIRFRK